MPLLITVGGCANRGMQPPASTPIVCEIRRAECTGEELPEGASGVICPDANFQLGTFFATICTNRHQDEASRRAECNTQFCNRANANPRAAYDDRNCEVLSANLADPILLPQAATCGPPSAGTGLSSIDFRLRYRTCTPEPGGVCPQLPLQSIISDVPPANCYDLSTVPAIQQVVPSSTFRNRSSQFLRVVRDDPACNATSALTAAYDVSGPVGTAAGAGLTVPFSATRGFAVLGKPCATCAFTTLDRMRINIADLTVAGVRLTNVVVTSTTRTPLQFPDPDDASRTGIAAGKLKLMIIGLENGVPSIYMAENNNAWILDAPAASFRLRGTLSVLDINQTGQPLPVAVAVDASGRPSTPQSTACTNLSPRARLFGFEDPQNWLPASSQATLSLVTSPVTQGCGGLGINGQGYMPINSTPFTTVGLNVTAAMSVDLFIPNNQPNQFWLGALQMYLTCPSANQFNQYIGQVELTGKPQNQYSTLRFPLPGPVAATLRSGATDCSFGFALNVNATNRTWILDNLRFTP